MDFKKQNKQAKLKRERGIRNRLLPIKNKLMVTRGDGNGGMGETWRLKRSLVMKSTG